MDDKLTVAIEAAKKAGEYIRKQYDEFDRSDFSYKTPHEVVSKVDTESERLILETIKATFPDHSYFSEEEGATIRESEFYWIIDPLDGSRHFLRKIKHFAVSIALIKAGKPYLGVVYNPMTDQIFTGIVEGQGQLNNEPIQVGGLEDIDHSIAAVGLAKVGLERERTIKAYGVLANHCATLRQYGASALDLCMIATGQLDSFVHVKCKAYDYSAGAIIAVCSGASVTDLKGNPINWLLEANDLLVTNKQLFPQYLEILKEI